VQRLADAITQGKTAGVFKGKARAKAVVTGGGVAAARAVGLLGGMFSWAEKRGLVSGPNPAHGVETARPASKDRILSAEELLALGKELIVAPGAPAGPIAALRLIALTGLRREEACGLRWSEIDFAGSCLRLENTKTGRSVRPIGSAARIVLEGLAKTSEKWAFPNVSKDGSADFKKAIATIFDAAGLSDVRSHDLRRTFGSIAADEGYSDSTIGDLLGHSRRGVTSQHYIRRLDEALLAAADRVASRISIALDGKLRSQGKVIALRKA
jgi:integrase